MLLFNHLNLCNPMDCSTQGFPVLHYLPELVKFMSIESVMLSNHLILCRPFLLLPSIFSSIRVFFNELALHIRWPKYWTFSFSNSQSNEYSELVSLELTDLISLLSKGLSRLFSSTTVLLFHTQQSVSVNPKLLINPFPCFLFW